MCGAFCGEGSQVRWIWHSELLSSRNGGHVTILEGRLREDFRTSETGRNFFVDGTFRTRFLNGGLLI